MAESEVEVSSSDDDLWTYGGGAGNTQEEAEAEAEAEADEEEADDDLDVYLPASKRAKLALERGRATKRPDNDEVWVISDDEAQEASKAGPSGAAGKPKDDEDDWGLESNTPPSSSLQRQAAQDPDLVELLRKNSEAMQNLEKATKEATVTVGDLEVEDRAIAIYDDDSDDGLGTLPGEAAAGGLAPAGGEKVLLCLRNGDGKEIKLRICKTDRFDKVLAAFRTNAVKKGWIANETAPVKLLFDGDVVPLSATPASLDCEDDDVIDVYC